MARRPLESLFKPASVALVCAGDGGTRHAVLARNLINAGFAGPIMAVSPDHEAVEGVPAHGSVAALPETPELAVIAAPPEAVTGLVEDLGKRGTRAIIVATGGPSDALRAAARHHGLVLLGPHSLGLLVPEIGLNASAAHMTALAGRLAFATRSGAMLTATLDWATARGIGFARMIALGDRADLDEAELLDFLALDSGVSAILLHLDRVADGRRFLAAARAAARVKPVVVLRAGLPSPPPRRGRSAMRGHGLATDDAVHEAAFRRAGLLSVPDLSDLFAAAEALAAGDEGAAASWVAALPGDRLAVVCNGIAVGALASNAHIREGGRRATPAPATMTRLTALGGGGEPKTGTVDLGVAADAARYVAATRALLDDPGVDAVLAVHGPVAAMSGEAAARALVDLTGDDRGKTGRTGAMIAAWLGEGSGAAARARFAAAGIPAYDSPERAVHAFAAMTRFRRNQAMLLQTTPSRADGVSVDRQAARAAVAAGRAARDRAGADRAARDLLTAYGIATGTATDGLALFAGIARTAGFGPVIVFADGAAEPGDPEADSAVMLPPLNPWLAREAMRTTRVYRRLRRRRRKRPPLLDALALLLVRLSQMVVDEVGVSALDVTLCAMGARLIAVEARARFAGGRARRLSGPAIRPYPSELETTVVLPSGERIALRPVRPADRPLFHAVFSKFSPEDIRMRFMAPVKTLTEAMAARLTLLDYDREMAFIAFREGGSDAEDALGVVRISRRPEEADVAEFAIIVRGERKRRGLGTLLMERIIAHARARGYRVLAGDVLRENHAMLGLARKLGFRQVTTDDDGGVARVVLPLTRATG